MVDVTTGAGGSSVLGQFADIQRKINEQINQKAKEKEELEKNDNLKGPSGDVMEYEKSVNKSSSDLKFFATDVGLLVADTTRLNVISSMAEGDNTDYFKFRVTGEGDAYLGSVGGEDFRIQLISNSGTVVADSDPESGSAFERYGELTGGKLSLSSGEYHLKVTRGEDAPKDKLNYALQLRMGDYKQDYDSIVQQPAPGDDPFAPTAGSLELQSMLTSGSSFLTNYQFGRSGSDKLMGAVFDGIF